MFSWFSEVKDRLGSVLEYARRIPDMMGDVRDVVKEVQQVRKEMADVRTEMADLIERVKRLREESPPPEPGQ
jgi:cell division protein FtsB